jgi:hypothetical protein
VLALLGRYSIYFVGWFSFSKNRIKIKGGTDCLSSVRSIAGYHDDPRHPRRSQELYSARCIASELIGEQDSADYISIHGDENAQS